MLDEKTIAWRYLKYHKKRTVLLVFGIAIAIALITTLFSIFEAIQQFEVVLYSENGIWHVAADECTQQQAEQLMQRADVEASGKVCSVSGISIENSLNGELEGCDENGLKQLNMEIESGSIPQNDNEIALEQWVIDKVKPGTVLGGTISVTLSDGTVKNFVLSGILKKNNSDYKNSYAVAAVDLSEAQSIAGTDKVTVFMQVRNNIKISAFIKNIENDQQIVGSNITKHSTLIAALGRSESSSIISIYVVAAILALLVVISAVVMIYNAFNISVAQRIRQFGMLRAMGATPKQLRKVVKSEAVLASLCGVIPGLLFGIIATAALIAVLKYSVPEYFPPEGPSIFISPAALIIGAVTGVATTVISSMLPARRAGKISPVEAMADIRKNKIGRKTSKGIATKLLPVESAVSIRQITLHKRSFILTAVSLSFGIILMLGFSVMADMLSNGTSQNYDLCDITVASKTGGTTYSDDFVSSILKQSGVESVSPVRVGTVDATFSYSMLKSDYLSAVTSGYCHSVQKDSDGMVVPAGKSTIVGLTDSSIGALGSKLVFGSADADELNRENGVLIALNNLSSVNVGDLRPGEYVVIGGQKCKICGIIKRNTLTGIYNDNPFIGIYTTNSVFEKYCGTGNNLVEISLENGEDGDSVLQSVKTLTSGMADTEIYDMRDKKSITNKVIMVGNIFIFGFIGVIALLGVLNIINTMSTNIRVRTREIGLLRAGGMTMEQVGRMIASEAMFYGVFALIIGLALGIPLERIFYIYAVKAAFSIPWAMPWKLILIASAATLFATMLSIISPLMHIKKMVVTEAINVE